MRGDRACAVGARLPATPRAAIVRAALAARGAVLTRESLDEAVAFANDWAAEHLLLAVSDDDAAIRSVGCVDAGTVFVGADERRWRLATT